VISEQKNAFLCCWMIFASDDKLLPPLPPQILRPFHLLRSRLPPHLLVHSPYHNYPHHLHKLRAVSKQAAVWMTIVAICYYQMNPGDSKAPIEVLFSLQFDPHRQQVPQVAVTQRPLKISS